MRAAIGIFFVLLAVGSLGLALRGQRHDIRDAFGRLSWQAAGVALVAVLLGLVAMMLAWRVVLESLGSRLHVRDAARIYYVGQLGKYLPGSVWPVLAQMQMGAALGIPRDSMFLASTIAVTVSLVSAAIIGVFAVPALLSQGGSGYLWTLLVIPVGLFVLHPRVLNRLLALVVRLLRRPPIEQQISGRALRLAFVYSAVGWALSGLQIFVLAHSIGGNVASLIPVSLGGFAIAFACGLLFLPSPAGLGVREAVLIACLHSVLSAGSASAVAIVSRLVLTLADVIVAGAAFIFSRSGDHG